MTRLYEARSRLAIFPETPNVLGLRESEGGYYGANEDENMALQTQVELAQRRPRHEVIESMQLDQNPRICRRQALSATGITVSKLDRIQLASPR